MTELSLETLRDSWRNQFIKQEKGLSQADIARYLKRESHGIFRQFHLGLVIDMWLKGALLLALTGLLVLLRDDSTVHLINTIVLAVVAFLVFFQWKTLRAIPGPTVIVGTLRAYLTEVTAYYRKHYAWTIWISGLTGSLVFYTGSQYYSFFKYDGIRPLDGADFTVFAAGVTLAYIIGVVAHGWQFRFHMQELEACLSDIEADTVTDRQIRQRRFQRLRYRLIGGLLLILGLLALAYFLR